MPHETENHRYAARPSGPEIPAPDPEPGTWPGIDTVFRRVDGLVAYEFDVAPMASATQIEFACDGLIAPLSISADGSLVLTTELGTIRHTAPRSFELAAGGARVEVPSAFELRGERRFGFAVDRVDRSRALWIDPGIDGPDDHRRVYRVPEPAGDRERAAADVPAAPGDPIPAAVAVLGIDAFVAPLTTLVVLADLHGFAAFDLPIPATATAPFGLAAQFVWLACGSRSESATAKPDPARCPDVRNARTGRLDRGQRLIEDRA